MALFAIVTMTHFVLGREISDRQYAEVSRILNKTTLVYGNGNEFPWMPTELKPTPSPSAVMKVIQEAMVDKKITNGEYRDIQKAIDSDGTGVIIATS